MSSPYDTEDGNFKRGATKPVAIIVGILLAAGAVTAGVLGIKGESEKMSKEDVAKEKRSIALLPQSEQLPKWRAWAANDAERHLQQEAIIHLAWAKDMPGLKIIIEKGLTSPDHGVRGTAAAALLEYGSPAADGAKDTLLNALKDADSSDKPQILWALAVLHDARAFDQVLADYRLGNLSKVQRLDGFPAFDPDQIAAMVSLDKLASLVGDESESVRQLVATVLSRTGDSKWTDTLIKLVKDPSVEVAREAAVGLGRIANEQAMAPLLDALSKADKPSRQKFLEALRDGVGGKGLVLALKSVSHDKPETENFQMKQIFDMLHDLEDPRGGDALVDYLKTNPKPHWKTEAAMCLAEIGDVRAAPYLGWRLKESPLKLYNEVDLLDMALRRDDNERVFGARMLADLAILHPEAHEQLRKDAEDGAYFWITDLPQPHANGLRFLAAVESKKVIPKLIEWSDPKEPLPKEGQQPPVPTPWVTAQSALRYLGWTKDPQGWPILEKQLTRRPAKIDTSWDSLFQGGLTILGMTLKALGHGSSDGFAQWGDSRAYPMLVKFIEEPKEHEDARKEACFALSWVATDDQMKDVVKKVHDNNKTDKNSQFLRGCFLETLVHRPVASATAGLVDLLGPQTPDMEVRHQIARAIGMGGVTPAMVPQLMEKLKDEATKTDAALALVLGADADTASRAIATYNDDRPEAMEELKDIYNKTFGYWSDKNYENGDIARWVANAEALGHVRVHDQLQDWPRVILGRNLVESIIFDTGPHSLTRVQFRYRLMQDAKGQDEAKRTGAIAILKFIKEKGILMALRHEPGPVGDLAKKAFFEVMNPKSVVDSVPQAPQAKDPGAAPAANAQQR